MSDEDDSVTSPVTDDTNTEGEDVAAPQGDETDSSSGTDDNSAGSSAAGSENSQTKDAKDGPKTMLDAVENALNKDKAPGASSTQDKKGDADKAAADQKDADVPKEFHNHPAWKRIMGERDDARKQIETLTQETESLRENAGRFESLSQFLTENKVSSQDAANAMRLAALSQTEPEKFFAELTEMHDTWSVILGKGLPADLQTQVDSGHMTEEIAKELALSRIKAKVYGGQVEANQQDTAARNQANERAATQQAIVNWEKNVVTRDPDYVAKTKSFVIDRMARIVRDRGQKLQGPADIVKVADQAYKEVKKEMAALLPQKPARIPVKPQGAGTPVAQTQPKTMLDVVAGALATG
jgi:hypothetical protein